MDFRTLNMPGPINLNQNIAPKVDATGNFLAGMAGGRQLRLDREAGEAEQRRQNALQEYMANPGMENVNSLMIDAPQQFGQAYKVEADKLAQQQEEAEKGRQSMARMMYEIELGPEEQRSQKYDAIRAQAEQNGEQWPEEYNPQFMRQRLAQIGTDKQVEGLYGGDDMPARQRAYLAYSQLESDDQRRQWMEANSTPPWLNMGGNYQQPMAGGPNVTPPKTLAPNELPSTKGAQTRATTDAAETAKAGFTKRKEAKQNQKAFEVYSAGISGLSDAMDNTATGPIVGRLPAFTAEQQIAEGAVSAMAPVLKQMFRAAGEGIFTDKDQELLLKMAPTRADRPEARAAKLKNIDAIVRAKLGMVSAQENVPPPNMFLGGDEDDVMRQADEILNGNR